MSLEVAEKALLKLQSLLLVLDTRFSDIELREEEGIPTEEFLESCYAIVPVLGKQLIFVLGCL